VVAVYWVWFGSINSIPQSSNATSFPRRDAVTSQPRVPESRSAIAGTSVGFNGTVMHSFDSFPSRLTELLDCAHMNSAYEFSTSSDDILVVIDGGALHKIVSDLPEIYEPSVYRSTVY